MYISLQQIVGEYKEFSLFFAFVKDLSQDIFWRQFVFMAVVFFSILGIFYAILMLSRAVGKGIEKSCTKFGYRDIVALEKKIRGKFQEIFKLRNFIVFWSIAGGAIAISYSYGLSAVLLLVYIFTIILSLVLFKRETDILSSLRFIRKSKLWKLENYRCIQLGIWSVFFIASVLIISSGFQFIVPSSADSSFGGIHGDWMMRYDQFVENNPEMSQHISKENFSLLVSDFTVGLKEEASQVVSEVTRVVSLVISVIMVVIIIGYASITYYVHGSKWFYSMAFLFLVSITFSFLYSFLFTEIENPLLMFVTLTVAVTLSMKIFKSLSIRRWAVVCPKCGELNPLHGRYCSNCGEKMDKGKVRKVK